MAAMRDESNQSPPSAAGSSSDSRSSLKAVRDPEKFDAQDVEGSRDRTDDPPLPDLDLDRTRTRTLGRLRLRGTEDDLPTDWWFASTAIPLVAATFAPMANLLSIAALVVSWRNHTITDDPATRQSTSVGYPDPQWCYNLNIASLVCGFLGNIFLLFNFTRRIRYIVALPATILLFYVASGILIAITASMHIYVPPEDGDIYSQGFWHAVIAACLYVFNSMILMVNMVGYFLGHYPQHFTLTDEQRNLILQTMLFFFWLGGGAGVFTVVCGWSYPDALYFCDVTILTIGFGDLVAGNDTGRGLVFPYSVGGIIILGLMVSSIHKFAGELTKDNVVRKHVEKRRVNTLSRAVTIDLNDPNITVERQRDRLEKELEELHGARPTISRPLQPETDPGPSPIEARQVQFGGARIDEATQTEDEEPAPNQFIKSSFRKRTRNTFSMAAQALKPRKQKAIIMKEEKDRFDAMRHLQKEARSFKKWSSLVVSVFAFGLLWCVGAVVFWVAENSTQDLSYFQALYFCYVSLLTIGYGDFSPKSNAGKPFFVVWSLIAIPTMTILVSGMGDTVIATFKRATIKLGDFTFLPKAGIWHNVLQSQPWLWNWLQTIALRKKLKKGMEVGPDPDGLAPQPTIEELASQDLTEAQMTRRLVFAIRRTADDLVRHPGKHYGYEEFADFTRLIRFTKMDIVQLELDEDQEGVVEWDWLDENSPMLSEQSEAEWVLDRLCESLLRWLRKNCIGNESALSPTEGAQLSPEERIYAGLGMGAALGLARTNTALSLSRTPTSTSAAAAATGRGTGAAMLDFFTGERVGENAYANREAAWSSKARQRQQQQQQQQDANGALQGGGRRRSSGGERKGPFRRMHLHRHHGAAPVTLKARALGLARK
jgi:potassium channel subfamily K, other eukaryote